jgi:transposase
MLLLEENKTKIIDMYNSGISTNKIAPSFNCSAGSIYLKLQEWGINIKKRQSFEGNIEDFKDEILQMYESGLGCHLISKKLNISKPTILRLVKKYSTTRASTRDDDNLLKDKSDLVIELFKTKNVSEISEIVGHKQSSVNRLLNQYGYDTSKYKCKHTVNESYFEKIDTNNKAYFLGWIYSDGNIMPQGKLRIQIQEEDLHILESLKKDIEYTGEIFKLKAVNERCKPQVLLNIDRMKIINDLSLLGLGPNKSLTLTLPTFEQIPEEFFSSYLRGFFDGDGAISVRPNGTTIVCSIASTDIFCKSLSDYMKTLDIHFGKFYYRKPDKPTGSMFLNKENSIKFLNYLYKDADLKLNRKYLKALPFLLPSNS